jgi:hypothetical protein
VSARSADVRRLPCIACEREEVQQPFPTTEHHLNSWGLKGKKRRGDSYSVSLCRWHHLGECLPGMSVDDMTHKFGPSWVHDKIQFRSVYGGDDALLMVTNYMLARLEPATA